MRGEFSPAALARHLGVHLRRITEMRAGDFSKVSDQTVRLMSRFIQDWENGMVEFAGHYRRTLVHRATPKPPPTVCKVDPLTATLKLMPRAPARERPPAPRDIFLTIKAK